MHVVFGLLLWASGALAPSGDPRAIDPAANRPEIVAPGGSPTKTKPPKTRPPKVEPKPPKPPKPKVEPKVEPKPEPKTEPKTEPDPTTEPKTEPDPTAEPEPRPEPKPKADVTADAPLQRCFPEHGRCWRLNVAGIVTAGLGVAALGTGIGFMQAPQYADVEEPIYNRSLRPPGVVMVALGAVTTVTGILMIVAGHASHGKPKRQTARVRLVPGGLRW